MAVQIKLYDAGMTAMLRSNPRGLIDQTSKRVAASINLDEHDHEDEADVTTRAYTTDRAAAAVAIDSPAGMAIEAKHSLLMRAAAAAGLEFRGA